MSTTTTTTHHPKHFAHHPCTRCAQPSTKDCHTCHQAFYCSRKCQTTHHKLHKRTCAALAQAQATRDAGDEQNARQQQQRQQRQRSEEAAARREYAALRRAWMMDAAAAGGGGGGDGGGGGGFVREFESVLEARRWVREVNELDARELADEEREREREGGEEGRGRGGRG